MPEESPSRSRSTRSQLAVNQPTRGADRNQQSLSETVDQPPDEFLFPSLDDGITLLDIEGVASQFSSCSCLIISC